VAIPFVPALVVGAGLLALWIDTRHPKLAPESLTKRFVAACCAMIAFEAAPIFHGSAAATYATVFALLLPLLVASFLASVWLLRAMRDAQFSG
jgi:hypothetical protein